MDAVNELPERALSPTGDPFLLTPGPLTTSPTVKQAMLHDFGSRDKRFIAINARVRSRLIDIIHGGEDFVCVPMQGSGTFVVEAMIGCFVPRDGKLLVLVNGAYGARMVRMCAYYGRDCVTEETAENVPCDPAAVERRLRADPAITHVAVVHCETTSGVLNPIAAVAEVVARQGRRLLIDSMSAFGALEVDARAITFDAVVASSNKCLEGAPGMGFCLARKTALAECAGNAASLSLDLHDQWLAMEKTAQWRFTPPVHCILAFDQALEEFLEEGGVAGRGGRYRENCRILVDGLRGYGFDMLLGDAQQAPIIVTVKMPADPRFVFQTFYDRLSAMGYVIYPGKLTVAESFRIGCIGRLGGTEMRGALAAIGVVLRELGVTDCAAAQPAG